MAEAHLLLMAKHFLIMDQEVYQKIPPKCIILDCWVFDSQILADKSFAKALQKFAICLLVNNNLDEKLVSSAELPSCLMIVLKSLHFYFLLLFLIY